MSIAPVAFEDISLQLEADLSENDKHKSAKAQLCVAPTKGGKSRFVLLCAVIAATAGVGLVLGLSLGLTSNESNSKSAEVEQPPVSNSDPAPMGESFDGSTKVKNYLCALSAQIPTDGTIILSQASTPRQDSALEDVPACFDGANTVGAWESVWYSVLASVDGEITATFNDVYTPTLNTQVSAFDTRVSAYMGDCGEQLACIGTQDMENGRLGSTTWTAVKGETYKLRVQKMPGANFGLLVTYKTATSLLNDVCANADPIPVDGTVVVGNGGHALAQDLPVCQDGRELADGGWFTVQADKTGPMVAAFFAFYTHYDINDFVSVYEGSCGDAVTCVDGTYTFDGSHGYYTWDAVQGVDYKIVVHSTGPFSLDVESF
jgi:hypothetical protein